jgi:predicted phage-related endonuclease
MRKVFDEKENDLLSNDSREKEKLTNYFANLIKHIKYGNVDFYEIYWKTVNQNVLTSSGKM